MSVLSSVTQSPMASAADAAQPVVWVEGVPRADLFVQHYRADAPLDARSVRCGVSDALWHDRRSWVGRRTRAALPHRLSDGTTRWEVLAAGVLSMPTDHRRSGTEERSLDLFDDWARRLGQPLGIGWVWSDGALERDAGGVLEAGSRANRSLLRHMVNGRSVYIMERGGEAWTLGDALDTVAAFAGVSLETLGLSDAVRAARLPQSVRLDDAMGDVLRRLLGPAGLQVRCTKSYAGGTERATQAVMPAASGRRFWLPWGGEGLGPSRVARVSMTSVAAPARRWVLHGARAQVEATLPLSPGWDAALEGEPDSAYGRSTSSDFGRFGAVYRRWVLNEDGAFSVPPFSAGESFDLAGLLRDPLVVGAPVPVGACLTRDGAGRRLAPVIEVSTDGGAAWSRYAGFAAVLPDRAGVLLEDDALPAAVLSAAKSGQLRVRVTGTLRSPRVLEAARWQGNPFAGNGHDRVLERGEAYGYRRVDASSIHAGAIDLGELEADEADDRPAMLADLLSAMAWDDEASASGEVELIGAWSGVRVGDRVLDVGGPGVGADGVPTSVEEGAVRVAGVRVGFGVAGGGPATRLVLG